MRKGDNSVGMHGRVSEKVVTERSEKDNIAAERVT
jgi:hypothetical protein